MRLLAAVRWQRGSGLPAKARFELAIGLRDQRTCRYANGLDILQLSADVDFPPCLLMRRMLEQVVDAPKQVGRWWCTTASEPDHV